ncbi:HAD superfamily hydrolase (TIGR01509 family) [Neolewinella xylanilytica]|uniref:HAD superfamily hydrolase (TIGR01509 family) n=1 Tax=Neolewinella xylanilytica TaxID=1514080 RepID=A0A2S6I0F4_9BACT|nr:HAD family phosphatase [Neolewinella xylanilytica]PPK84341.1 HAD superfamily hydrolase (TIGR01509 family) [Neolewinella xylanilytica]
MLKGLLCDLDGTLADSEPLHCTAWLTLLSEDYGVQYDTHWFEQWIGTSDTVVAASVIEEHDWEMTVAELIDEKQARFQAAVRREGSVFAGVPELLEKIAARFPLAIATNSGRSDADLMIASTRLDRFTSISVTATDVEHMKPEPDIYLLAAEKLGLPASECIAIEDSGPGGVAAKAAGCYLIGLTDKVTNADEMVTDNAKALKRALELLEAG